MFDFVPIEERHMTLFRHWLNQDHVKKFWQESDNDEILKEKFLKKLPQRGIRSFIIEQESKSIGYIQYYDCAKIGGGWWVGEKPGSFGIDLMIGDVGSVGKGFGPKVIKDFILLILANEPAARSIIVDPDPSNLRAIRAFERAGFGRDKQIETPNGAALLMRMPLLNLNSAR
jgi:RimJ/RimL family protein N-acetyltransferase